MEDTTNGDGTSTKIRGIPELVHWNLHKLLILNVPTVTISECGPFKDVCFRLCDIESQDERHEAFFGDYLIETLGWSDADCKYLADFIKLYNKDPRTKEEQAGIVKIVLKVGEKPRILRETLEALGKNPTIYRRGPLLVKTVVEDRDKVKLAPKTTMKNVAGSLATHPFEPSGFGAKLPEYIKFVKEVVTKEGETVEIPVDPPPWLCQAVLKYADHQGVREIRGLSESPFLCPDGSIFDRDGLDEQTGTYVSLLGKFPDVSQSPTLEDAQAALQRIMEYFRLFPFQDDKSRAVFLAGLLTAMARPSIRGPVPGIAFTGQMGTGKTKLVDAIAVISTGRECPATSYPGGREGSEEMRKILTSLALNAAPIVNFDDLMEGIEFGNGPIDSALTAMVLSNRRLGFSEMIKLPLRPTWFLTGVGIKPGRTAIRRWLMCYLETPLEHPELRGDTFNLLEELREKRPTLVRDCLIILRAHAIAEYPRVNLTGQLGSFDEWDKVVRGAISWVSQREVDGEIQSWDCIATLRETIEDNPGRDRHIRLCHAMKTLPDSLTLGHTLAYMIRSAKLNPERYPELDSALRVFGAENSLPSEQKLVSVFRSLKNKTVEGMRIVTGGRSSEGTRWLVKVIEPKPEPPKEEQAHIADLGHVPIDLLGDPVSNGDDRKHSKKSKPASSKEPDLSRIEEVTRHLEANQLNEIACWEDSRRAELIKSFDATKQLYGYEDVQAAQVAYSTASWDGDTEPPF